MGREPRRALVLGLALALGAVCVAGCVQRRMTIRTSPPGAMVYVDDYPLGASPISTNFTYYGTRKIRLVKDGYETMTVMQPIWPAFYEIPPVDFVSENILPGELRDHRDFCYQLRPQMVVPPEQLLSRGEELRRAQACAAVAVPPPAAGPAIGPGPVPPAGPPPGAVPPGMVPLRPAPESVPAQPIPQPQGFAPGQPSALQPPPGYAAPGGPVGPAQPEIGGQLPHPLPPP